MRIRIASLYRMRTVWKINLNTGRRTDATQESDESHIRLRMCCAFNQGLSRSSPVARRAESAGGWIEAGPVFA